MKTILTLLLTTGAAFADLDAWNNSTNASISVAGITLNGVNRTNWPSSSGIAGIVSNNVASAGLLSVDATKTNGISPTAAHVSSVLEPNTVYVNTLVTGGAGTDASPWTGLETATLNTTNTVYKWTKGVYLVTNTLDLLISSAGHTNLYANTRHVGGGVTIKYTGSGPALRAANTGGWSIGFGISGFRVDGSNAVYAFTSPTAIVGSGMSGASPLATVTLANHGFTTGDMVWMQQITPNDYNGIKLITVTDANTFTYRLRSGINVSTSPTGTFRCWKKAVIGFQFIGVRDAHFEDLYAGNVLCGYDVRACVTDDWDNIRVTKNEQPGLAWVNIAFPGAVQPECGMYIGTRLGTTDSTTTQTFRNLVLEHTGSNPGATALDIYEADNNVFTVGTCESNAGDGVHVNGGVQNTFIGWDNEVNSGSFDWALYGSNNGLLNCYAGGTVGLTGGFGPWITGGRNHGNPSIVISNAVHSAVLQHAQPFSVALLADSGVGTLNISPFYEGDSAYGGVSTSLGYSLGSLTNTALTASRVVMSDANKVASSVGTTAIITGAGVAATLADATNTLGLTGSTTTYLSSAGTQSVPPGSAAISGTVSNAVASAGLLSVDSTKTNGIAATKAHITNAWGIFTGEANKYVNGDGSLGTPTLAGDNWAASGTTNSTLAGNALVGPGSAALPSLGVSTTTNGLYASATDQIGFATQGTGRWFINAAGSLLAVTDAGVSIGASGANRPANVTISGTSSGTTFTSFSPGSFSISSRGSFSSTADGLWTLKKNDASTPAILTLGGTRTTVFTTATNYTASVFDHTVLANGTTLTITLPTAVGVTGQEYIVKLIANSTATVATTSSQTIDGLTSYILAGQNEAIALQSDGSNWKIIALETGTVVSSAVASGSAVSLSNATATNITSISLTAGDWDVRGNVNFSASSATVTGTVGGLSSTSATLPTDGTEVYSGVQVTLLSETDSVTLPAKQFNVSATTTVYLVGKSTFSAGTVTAFGSIQARRIR